MPLPEDHLTSKPKYKLKVGLSYLISEKEPVRSSKLFMDQTTHGVPGLWVTTMHPNKIKVKYGLARSCTLYLTSERVVGEVTAPPDKFDRATAIISNYFFATAKESVVLVDCLKELIAINGFEKTMDFLKEMADLCSQYDSNLIVPIDPSGFTKNQLAALKMAMKASWI